MQDEFWNWRWPITSVNIRYRVTADTMATKRRSTRIAVQAAATFRFNPERVEAVTERRVGGINTANGMSMSLGSTKLFVDPPHSTNKALEVERALFIGITFIPEDSSMKSIKKGG
jgi:hypothetical protein